MIPTASGAPLNQKQMCDPIGRVMRKRDGEAERVGAHRSRKVAPTEYIQRRKRRRLVELFGRVDFDPRYDYKKARNR